MNEQTHMENKKRKERTNACILEPLIKKEKGKIVKFNLNSSY